MKSFKLLFAFFMILMSNGIKAFHHHHNCLHKTLHQSRIIYHSHNPHTNCHHNFRHYSVGHKTVHGYMTNVAPSSKSIITPQIGLVNLTISS